MTELLEWLEGTGLAAIVRESLYGFQILVAVHIVGIIFSVGVLLWADLRMLGLGLSGRRLSEVHDAVVRWYTTGFVVMFASGLTLFVGFATSAYENVFFRIKIAVIVLAGINAVVFHACRKRLPDAADAGPPPGFVRLAGGLSVLFWGVTILCGRMMSYTLF